jgi:hypothetical protein
MNDFAVSLYFIRAHIYAGAGILAQTLFTLPAIAAEPFPSS